MPETEKKVKKNIEQLLAELAVVKIAAAPPYLNQIEMPEEMLLSKKMPKKKPKSLDTSS